MNSSDKFSSIFAPYIRSYIKEKELQDLKIERYRSFLLDFDRFLSKTAKNDLLINSEDIKRWADTRINDKKTTLYARFCIISNFCRYMGSLGHECYVPLHPRRSFESTITTVFTHSQIHNIFDACDNMVTKTRCPKSMLFVIPALIRTLYSTGIRIGEALTIMNKDIDFKRNVLVINDTKNNRCRIAPINESLEKVLKQYIKYRDKLPICDIDHPDSYLFVSTLGKSCSHIPVYKYFVSILEKCEIYGSFGTNNPSLHSIRHTTAVHSLVKLTGAGKDLYCSLPLLSVFLGHKSVIGTESYVRLTQEMYPEVLKLDMHTTDQIFADLNLKLQKNYEKEDN
ncbi:tyrosine-type recombinase/integrase [Flavobacterium pectinovorum]|uniref:Nicotinate-nucleotide pyrophosphorylase n=1 Tax=Flavobacterium pectinovorum TaxID=29533 RepID=A0A502EQQ8_9FLAO|nr:tyrosine-type recombinase/integrase [Flavobacterium pectinovorum]TPG38521.1 nicotinate-nucleotide pyrophosphorylase [Flavobacterium pectinovorum]